MAFFFSLTILGEEYSALRNDELEVAIDHDYRSELDQR